MGVVVWHGSQSEATELLAAIARNCGCTTGIAGQKTSTCAAHEMLVSDQRAIDSLVFCKRIRDRWIKGEWECSTSDGPLQP